MDNRALTNFLAEQYPTFSEARDLWKRSGGNAARVPEGPNARVRWATLIEQMEGGAIDPLRLISEALREYPNSPVLFDALATRVPDTVLMQAREFVQALGLREAPRAPNVTALTALPETTASAALAVELRALPGEEQEEAKSFLQRMKEGAAQTVGTELPKALITVATTAVTMLLKGEL